MLLNKLMKMRVQEASPREEGSANRHHSARGSQEPPGAPPGERLRAGVSVVQASAAPALGCASLWPASASSAVWGQALFQLNTTAQTERDSLWT